MLNSVIIISLCKLLLLKTYKSTDFEVHRNWLAITHSLQLKEWYKDETSEWTLDYPPFFAFFEWILSQIAYYFDSSMLVVSNLNYASEMTIFFQRISVIFTDFLLAYSLVECFSEIKKEKQGKSSQYNLAFILTFGNAGLVLVDHIHFQYNGFLFGVMFLSIVRIWQNRELEGAFWFSVLLNLKHIYLYIAPAYFVYLLRSYCFRTGNDGCILWLSFSVKKLLQLAVIVISVFTVSFSPFIASDQLFQVISRLFPFKRGLCHAYWAPNFWALYNFVDKILTILGTKLNLIEKSEAAVMTGGLVQEFEHIVLPTIQPSHTFILTVLFILPCLVKLWRTPHSAKDFLLCVCLCAFSSFMFGWHVHEKAILMVLLPLSLLSLFSRSEAKIFVLLNMVATFSLFPLIFTSKETVLKVSLYMFHVSLTCVHIRNFYRESESKLIPLLNKFEILYVMGLLPLFMYDLFIHKLVGLDVDLPFLPLMLISIYCSCGIMYCYIRLYVSFITVDSMKDYTLFKGKYYKKDVGVYVRKSNTKYDKDRKKKN